MNSISSRLKRLEGMTMTNGKTVFLLLDGGTFVTEDEPIAYLLQHGPYTPGKRRIAGLQHDPFEGMDDLSRSLYEMIDHCIQKGEPPFPDSEALKSDDFN